ncbi:MAG TPA: GntR family transcriptional regulator [Hyphomicrobiaceae bacterium]|nr:GntR family transcriptional regulator [Hyphomicrobiaceae bacterium]
MVASTKSLAREPLYVQVCLLITRQIAGGVWKPNAALPNEIELSRELGVSSGTIRKALERLEADRLVVRRQGRGTFVVDQTGPEMVSRFDRIRRGDGEPIGWKAELLQRDRAAPTSHEQKTLQVAPTETVARKRRLLSVSGRGFAVEDATLAIGHLPGLDSTCVDDDWCLTRLAQQHAVHISRATEEVRLAPATPEIAALLSVAPGATLVRLDRIISSAGELPLEWRSAVCHLQDEYYQAEVN